MVGPQDGGFGFDQSKKYTSVDNWKKSVFNAKLVSTKIVLQRPRRYQCVIANTVKFTVKTTR